MKKFIASFFLIAVLGGVSAFAQSKTVVNNVNAKKMVLGKHLLTLQWISWDYFGAATVTERNGVMRLKGEQKQRSGSDYVRLDGTITEINAKDFIFDGEIEMRVSHINGGEPCKRTGEMTFAITQKRRYWRLQQMDNPCDEATDYVDIYLR